MKIVEDLKRYIPYNEQERKDVEEMIKFIAIEDAFLRTNKIAHFTASSWIVNKDFTKVLMVYHNIYDSWSWTGGHADGDVDLLNVALREAKEETHIAHIYPYTEDIFSLETLTVDGHIKKGEYVPSHLHLNVTYLLVGDDNDDISPELNENNDVKWIDIDEVKNEVSEKWMINRIYNKLNNKLISLKEGKLNV